MTFTYANERVALNSDFHKLNSPATQMSDGSLVDPTRPRSIGPIKSPDISCILDSINYAVSSKGSTVIIIMTVFYEVEQSCWR